MQFAKAKEAEGNFQDAVDSYERAGDSSAMVRLLLDKLNNANKAFAIARTSRNKASASMVARYCLSKSNWENAVEFLMDSGERDEAWALAQTHGVMHAYSQALGDDATPAMHAKVALYYQNAGAG
jgi:WD repeat-containing protein 19